MPRLPCRIDPLIASWPLHGAVTTRAIEQRAAAALPAHELMRRAGLGVARLALALAPHAPRFIVLAGPGNNGGDGIEAALQLQLLGKQTRVRLLADAARLPADAADALARAQAAGVPIEPGFDAGIGNDDDAPVIDALLGIGSKRAPQGALARAIEALRARRGIVLAVDVPSGLDALTGQPIGEHAVRATHTLSLLTLKPGLFTGTGRDHAGEAWFDDLGVAADLSCADALLAGGVSMTHDVEPRHADHKGSRGDVHVVGGAPGMSGAALLAARAAHAAGAGRVYVVALDPGATLLDAARPELMFRARWWQAAPAEIAHGIVLAGCGGGDAVRAALPPLLSNATQLVLDADALNAIAGDESLQALLVARAARGGRPTIATPHPLEAARLLGITAREVQADRLEAATRLAERYGCVALLKGSGSIVAAPGRTPYLNPTGNAALATAGTGDVLAGWIAGRWAQAHEGDSIEAAQRIAAQAAFRHGLAADRHGDGDTPLRAADLVERMLEIG
jgi:hydroxyethylthiazole kinase-like uncharacterized protein yjeF